jgi:hypothetical protein
MRLPVSVRLASPRSLTSKEPISINGDSKASRSCPRPGASNKPGLQSDCASGRARAALLPGVKPLNLSQREKRERRVERNLAIGQRPWLSWHSSVPAVISSPFQIPGGDTVSSAALGAARPTGWPSCHEWFRRTSSERLVAPFDAVQPAVLLCSSPPANQAVVRSRGYYHPPSFIWPISSPTKLISSRGSLPHPRQTSRPGRGKELLSEAGREKAVASSRRRWMERSPLHRGRSGCSR